MTQNKYNLHPCSQVIYMCVCVYVCMCVYVCVCVCIYIYILFNQQNCIFGSLEYGTLRVIMDRSSSDLFTLLLNTYIFLA